MNLQVKTRSGNGASRYGPVLSKNSVKQSAFIDRALSLHVFARLLIGCCGFTLQATMRSRKAPRWLGDRNEHLTFSLQRTQGGWK